jgi:hypothetical protein
MDEDELPPAWFKVQPCVQNWKSRLPKKSPAASP